MVVAPATGQPGPLDSEATTLGFDMALSRIERGVTWLDDGHARARCFGRELGAVKERPADAVCFAY